MLTSGFHSANHRVVMGSPNMAPKAETWKKLGLNGCMTQNRLPVLRILQPDSNVKDTLEALLQLKRAKSCLYKIILQQIEKESVSSLFSKEKNMYPCFISMLISIMKHMTYYKAIMRYLSLPTILRNKRKQKILLIAKWWINEQPQILLCGTVLAFCPYLCIYLQIKSHLLGLIFKKYVGKCEQDGYRSIHSSSFSKVRN